MIPSRFDDVCQFTNITTTTIDPPQEDPNCTTSVVNSQVEFAEAAASVISILSQPAPVDMTYVESLRSFLTRPYPIYNGEWSGDDPAGGSVISFNPLKLYLDLPIIQGKLDGFSYLRAGLRIEVRINGTRFHYGQLVTAFCPLSGTYQNYPAQQIRSGALTMFPSIIQDPGPSEVGVLEVPYVYPQHFMSITDVISANLGQLHMKVLVPLRVVSSTIVPRVNFTVYCSLVDPIINAFSGTGLSTPLLALEEQSLDSSIRVTPEANNMMATNINDVTFRAGMNGSNSIAQEEQYIGVSRDDMNLAKIYTKPNFLAHFEWHDDDAPSTVLHTAEVSPFQIGALNTPHYLSTISRLFAFWRGSLRYHIRVVASGFHSGRLLISWEPSFRNYTGRTLINQSNRMSMVVDIQETTDIYLTIPYMSRYPWCQCNGGYTGAERMNGHLQFSVLNTLAVPDTSPTTVDVLVWMYGSDDLEFAMPAIGSSIFNPSRPYALEEQCLDMPLNDSKFGNLDGSFSVPGKMVMGESIKTIHQLLQKKTYLGQTTNNGLGFASSVYSQQSSVTAPSNIYRYSHFRILSEIFLLHRGSVNYVGFVRPYEPLNAPPDDEYWLGFNHRLDPTALYGLVQVRSSTPNAMLSVPYYTNYLFHTTRPDHAVDEMPSFCVLSNPSGTAPNSIHTVWASAGDDYMMAYLIPPYQVNG